MMVFPISQTKKRRVLRPPWSRPIRIAKSALPNVVPAGGEAPLNQTLPPAVRRIAQALDPEKIILFGSYAYGHPHPDSDVDLLVILKTRALPKDRYLAVCRLLRPRPFAVDLMVKTPQEIKTALKRGDFFIQEIVTQGRVLYERS